MMCKCDVILGGWKARVDCTTNTHWFWRLYDRRMIVLSLLLTFWHSFLLFFLLTMFLQPRRTIVLQLSCLILQSRWSQHNFRHLPLLLTGTEMVRHNFVVHLAFKQQNIAEYKLSFNACCSDTSFRYHPLTPVHQRQSSWTMIRGSHYSWKKTMEFHFSQSLYIYLIICSPIDSCIYSYKLETS